MVIAFTLGKGGGGGGQMGKRADGYGFRADFTPSVLRWRKNDGKSYLKVKINMFLRPENEFTRLRTTLTCAVWLKSCFYGKTELAGAVEKK